MKLELTKNEALVLAYLVYGANSPYAADPLKDIYEYGIESNKGYAALKTLAKKLEKAGV